MRILILFLLAGMIPDLSFAEPKRERTMESARAYGRGKTFVAAKESDESHYLNPATIAENHGMNVQFRWMQLDGFVGQNSIDTVSDIANMSSSSVSPVGILQQFNNKFGKQQYIRLQGNLLGIRLWNVDIAPFMRTSNWIDMRVPTTPDVWMHSDTITGANVSVAFPIGKKLFIGVTTRPFFRFYFDTDVSFAEMMEFEPLGDLKASDKFKALSGGGVGVDLGAIYYLGKATRLGLTIEDVGYTSYAFSEGKKDTPPNIPTNLSMGVMHRLDYKPWHLDLYTDLQDLMNTQGLHGLRLFHFGAEMGREFWSRDHDMGVLAGLNEGYITFGAFMNLLVARLDIVSYGVELGEYPGQRQDRRLAINLRSSLSF